MIARASTRETVPRSDFDDVARRHADYLIALASRSLGSELRAKVSAEDLVQETLLRAHRHALGLARWEAPRQRAWLRRVLGNQLKDAHRRYCRAARRSAHREVAWRRDFESTQPERLSVSAQAELLEFVQTLFASLSRNEALVLKLRFWEQQSFAEIGRSLRISPEAARRLWFRGIVRLRPRVLAEIR